MVLNTPPYNTFDRRVYISFLRCDRGRVCEIIFLGRI
nr:MAG TPA: hypothetical protein [Caudoviricetes sp.]